ENTRRQKSLRAAQADPGAGVRHHQIGDGLPAVLDARPRRSSWRVEPRDHGMEHQAHVRPDPRLRAPLSRVQRQWLASKPLKIASAPARRAASLPILGYKPRVATRLNNSVRQAARCEHPSGKCPISGFAVVLPQGKIPRGNSALTMISVWLGSYGRADSPRFDMLAGDAGLGFGRA